MKAIKFDLPIDGTKVRTIEELREHFSTEILDLYKNGLLLKWLINQRYPSYAQAVEQLLPTETDANLLKLLCGIFEVDVDFDTIQQLADYHGSGIKIDPEQLQYKQKYEERRAQAKGKIISFDDEFIGSSVDMETIIKMHKFHTGEDIILVPVLGNININLPIKHINVPINRDNYDFNFDFFKKIHKYNKGDRVNRGENLFNERFPAIAPCDGILYKKVLPARFEYNSCEIKEGYDLLAVWMHIVDYNKGINIAYLQVNI